VRLLPLRLSALHLFFRDSERPTYGVVETFGFGLAGHPFDGHYENHLNWDAVKIFRSAWPNLDDETRRRARREISRMLEWCLTKSYQPDGSFKVSDLDDTQGDAFRYGIWFLQETGYFQPKDRFWTDQDFPNSKSIQDQIEAKLKSIGLNDPALKEAYETLHAMD
jgi:hypothetical protein